jgi:FlaA1/EpsC-like NDP-sugar epimerase
MMMWAMRVLAKTVYESMTTDRRALKALIYGVQDGGVGLAKNIRTQRPTRFVLNGFITTDKGYAHHSLMGERVYTNMDELRRVIRQQHIDAVLVSPQCNQGFRRNQALQDMLIGERVKIYMASAAEEWTGEGESKGIQVKEVSVEDLLPRDEIRIDMKSVGELLKGRRVLITGAAGSIGSEIVRQVAEYGPEGMMLIDQAETPMHDIRLMMANEFPQIQAETVVTSISRKTRMEAIFSTFRPDYVFHAAAYKHVPMMEDNPSEAVLNNIYGTKVVADYAVKYGVKKFVMVSTDKAVNPTNVMGCSKRICEIYVQSLNRAQNVCQFVTTRFGNVLGSSGSVIPLFEKQIKEGGPITVTDERIVRYFMLIPEACKLVLEAATHGHGGEIFAFDMGEPVKIADLARRMILLSNATNVKIKFVGLRPGEKLYEEVLNNEENTIPSFHEKIRIAIVREYDFEKVSKEIDELISVAKTADDMTIVKMMKALVPEYKSENSKYKELDNE